MCSVSRYRLALAVLASVPLAALSGRWCRRGRGLFRTGSGSRCASPDKRSTPSPSGYRTQTSLRQTRTCRQRAHSYRTTATGRVTSLRRGYLSQATLPVWVDGAFVELYGLLCPLQFSRGILKLGANSAETRVTLTDRQEETDRWVQQPRLLLIAGKVGGVRRSYLKGVRPAAGFIVQHMEQVSSTLLRGTQVLQTDTCTERQAPGR